MNRKRWLSVFLGRFRKFLNLLAHGRFTKAKNYLLTNVNMVRQSEYATHYPITLVIDPGNVCNLACALCVTGQKKSLRPPKLLSFSDFKRIVDQLGKRAVQLDLYNWGEPFLNQEIFKMITYAKKKWRLRVEISSNLVLLTPKLAEKTIKSGLDRLIVSLHGATPKTTKIFMKGGDFNRVIKNLKLLIKLKKQLKSKTPSITWRFVVSRYNQSELKMAAKLSQKLGLDYFEPIALKLDSGFDPDEVTSNIKKQAHWLPKKKKYRLYHPKTSQPLSYFNNCFWPWEIVAVNADGAIQPCCVFTNPKFDFGNLFEAPFEKIWNGPKYRAVRKILREKIKTDQATICGLCVANGFIGK